MTRVLTAVVLSLPLVGAYGIFAIGIVMIYRASQMLNLAHGAMAMVPAFLLFAMVRTGLPPFVALPLAIASGGLLGFAVQKTFVGRLRAQGPTAQTIGTVAALGIMIAVVARIFGASSQNAVPVFPSGRVSVGLSSIQMGEIGLFAVMLVIAAALYVLIQKTDLGLMMRGTAESPLAASLMGVNPGFITSVTWVIGGSLAGLAGILLAAVTVLHPYTLSLQVLPAFIAALLGGLGSLPGALMGSAIVGVTQGLVPVLGPVANLQGAPQFFLAILAMVVMVFRGKRLVAGSISVGDTRTASQTSGARAAAGAVSTDDGRNRRASRRRLLVFVLALGVISVPFVDKIPSSVIGSANLAASYTLIAVSLVLLTGWVGQISLGHAALVGIGSYATGYIVVKLGIPFPLSLPVAAAVVAIASAILGAVALRVRGLYLAVATLVFSWMASEFLFRQGWLIENSLIPSQILGRKETFPFFDLTNRRTFYLVAWALTAAVILLVANLRDSKTGRAFFAVRGSEIAAASLGIDVIRYKLLAFAASGAIAGIAGNLIMTDARVVTADQFTFRASLFFLAVAVVGGLRSLPGAITSGLVFAGLTEVFFRVPALGAFLELVSSLLLGVTLLLYSGGLASVPSQVRQFAPVAGRLLARLPFVSLIRARAKSRSRKRAFAPPRVKKVKLPIRPALSWIAQTKILRAVAGVPRIILRRRDDKHAERPLDFASAIAAAALQGSATDFPQDAASHSTNGKANLAAARKRLSEVRVEGDRNERRALIEAENVTVRFGGLVAVDDASLAVREGEIVGLIGPNGAGKTTLFNAIAGYNSPVNGTIRLYGKDVTRLPVHRRAQVGVARTFQLIQLFPELSVYQNLLVATHGHNSSGFVSHLLVSSRSMQAERAARRRVGQILELLELKELAHQRAGDLPFGTLRMVEVARALVTGYRVVMLDEPASGLDNTETDRLMEVLRFIRGMGATLLLIEHDVRMVTGVSDYMYVLDQGKMIAEGPPDKIQRDPSVIAAYLGEPAVEAVV